MIKKYKKEYQKALANARARLKTKINRGYNYDINPIDNILDTMKQHPSSIKRVTKELNNLTTAKLEYRASSITVGKVDISKEEYKSLLSDLKEVNKARKKYNFPQEKIPMEFTSEKGYKKFRTGLKKRTTPDYYSETDQRMIDNYLKTVELFDEDVQNAIRNKMDELGIYATARKLEEATTNSKAVLTQALLFDSDNLLSISENAPLMLRFWGINLNIGENS